MGLVSRNPYTDEIVEEFEVLGPSRRVSGRPKNPGRLFFGGKGLR